MRAWGALLLPCASLAFVAHLQSGVNALPQEFNGPLESYPDHALIYTRDEHMHAHGHSAPLTELNETAILQWHKPTPPSYQTHDFEDSDVTKKYPHLMALHATFMSLAFLGALPVGMEIFGNLNTTFYQSNAAYL